MPLKKNKLKDVFDLLLKAKELLVFVSVIAIGLLNIWFASQSVPLYEAIRKLDGRVLAVEAQVDKHASDTDKLALEIDGLTNKIGDLSGKIGVMSGILQEHTRRD